MKKSLSAVLATSMVLSMLASAVYADDAATTTPALDAQAKYEALVKAGVFDGMEDGKAHLEDPMTREQFAKVIIKLAALSEVKTSTTYSDVAADRWSAGFIEAATKAGYVEGVTDATATSKATFDPSSNVTTEQLAKLVVKALKLPVDTTAKVDGKVSDWAKGYVAAAIKAGVLSASADFTGNAIRSTLVNASFAAQDAIAATKKVTNVSIADAQATSSKVITVKLNGGIADTTKLTVDVSRGGAKLSTTAKWSANNDSVALTLGGKLQAGTYTVNIAAVKDGGLTVDKATSDVTVTDEKITKIEFTTTGDTIPNASGVKIGFKATNQYNEVSDYSASRFSFGYSPTGLSAYSNPAGDAQTVSLNVYQAVKDLVVQDNLNTTFVVTVVAPDNTAQASKVFKLGQPQTVSKIEFGDLKLQSGKDSFAAGDTATLDYKAYDQYGIEVTDLETLRRSTSLYNTGAGAIKSMTWEAGSSKPELRIVASDTLYSDQTVTLSGVGYGSGTTATKQITVTSPKAAYDVSFGSFNKTIALGDGDVFIPLVVKDQKGATLSADDIVKAYDVDKSLNVYGGTGGVNVVIETKPGADKGKVKVNIPDTAQKGSLSITAMVNRTGKSATYTTSIYEQRVPNSITISSSPKDKLLPNAKSDIKFKFNDQFNEDYNKNNANYRVDFKLTKTSGSLVNAVTWNGLNDNPTTNTKSIFMTDITSVRDKGMSFQAANDDNVDASYELSAKLVKLSKDNNGKDVESVMSTVTRSISAIKASEADKLTYSLASFDNGILAAAKIDTSLLSGANLDKVASWFDGKIDVTAKDAAGKSVGLPSDPVKTVAISNSAVARFEMRPKLDDNVANDVYAVKGIKAGTTSVTVTFVPSSTGTKIITADNIQIKDDAPVAASLTAEGNGKSLNVSLAALNGLDINTKKDTPNYTFGDIKMKDQTGNVEFKNYSIYRVAKLFGVQFVVSDIKWDVPANTTIKSGTGNVSVVVDEAGTNAALKLPAANYSYTPATLNEGGTAQVKSFKITVITANGMSQSVDVFTTTP